MDNHSLIKVAHMLHRVHLTIVGGERWLMKSPRKYCPFNFVCEGRLENLVHCFVHSIISQASVSWALVSTFMMVFYIIGKKLVG